MKTVLTIAGSDSGAGAGIQADLKTFGAFSVYGTCALTALTAQNTTGVQAVFPVDADFVVRQIEAVASDIRPDAVKTGMLAERPVVEGVARAISRLSLTPLVVDPVIVSTSGDRLLAEEAVGALREKLIPQADVTTPNVREAEILSGVPISGEGDYEKAAKAILALGAKAVVITGGSDEGEEAVDRLYDPAGNARYSSRRVRSRNTHGTGCTFSAAITARLALGDDLRRAVACAKQYVTEAIAGAPGLGKGYGPVHHGIGRGNAPWMKGEGSFE